ncbi:dof zinc finger protein DOF1.5 [Punica granatum]|uniref:Dof-type domain-containing protein n=2 Tax=Punica granatum TaxID=22663 RepID=A0A218WLP9_PUNGR|nr:dof zinc finger protein DOF1.5 [Punica granatum]OWM72952.1 hypothetical protein CDL15_Pgr001066 [Punica granatum]PKI70756.1 hypothetical protein CRG98_008848 [Punica granatum]
MAEAVHGGKEATNIKLFGTTIKLQGRQQATVKDEESNSTLLADDHRHHRHQHQQAVEEMKRPNKIIPCPRCNSMDTKFCYFNNYNVNQPRHFCRGCQRYWTAGGALRNVPIGAGRRKSKLPPPPSGNNNFLYEYSNNSDVQSFGLNNIIVSDAYSGRFPTSFSG